jgi:hypothetical protein
MVTVAANVLIQNPCIVWFTINANIEGAARFPRTTRLCAYTITCAPRIWATSGCLPSFGMVIVATDMLVQNPCSVLFTSNASIESAALFPRTTRLCAYTITCAPHIWATSGCLPRFGMVTVATDMLVQNPCSVLSTSNASIESAAFFPRTTRLCAYSITCAPHIWATSGCLPQFGMVTVATNILIQNRLSVWCTVDAHTEGATYGGAVTRTFALNI